MYLHVFVITKKLFKINFLSIVFFSNLRLPNSFFVASSKEGGSTDPLDYTASKIPPSVFS